jgi:internalin A
MEIADLRIGQVQQTGSKMLNLVNLQLARLPDSLWQLGHLEQLTLEGNALEVLPSAVGNLTNLQTLILSRNTLVALPSSISSLSNLQRLALIGNKLHSFPEGIIGCKKLVELALANNQLESLPNAISELKRLKWLNLDNNQLVSLPASIGFLRDLEVLRLGKNKLTQLPSTIGRLTKLREFGLRSNQLSWLPETIRSLTTLTQFDLCENLKLGLPVEVIGADSDDFELSLDDDSDEFDVTDSDAYKDEDLRHYKHVFYSDTQTYFYDGAKPPAEIIDYYFRTRTGSRPLNEAKIIFVGRGEVGKTSLINRLVFNTYDAHENKTEGIRITKWHVKLKEDDLTLHIWDFGGQEIMHATHQFFLTERSLYLLVLNGRQGQEDAEAEYWLRLIASLGGNSPVIVVMNKVGQHLFDLNRGALQQKYPNIVAFVKTDCKDRTGIDDMRKLVAREVDRLPHLRAKFPAEWFRIKEQLADMEHDYVTFEKYRALCNDLGEKDAKAQEDLAGFLHALGVALNYRDDPRLSDKHVLNPHWVTDGLYTVLNAKKLEASKGQLAIADLTRLLPSATYPKEMHGFLLELMRKFELCFPFPDDPSTYLVPELLGKDQPPAAAAFDPAECLNFEYGYTVLPEGLIPRFIVRTHALSEGQPRWRSGVILEFDGNRALVKADPHDTRRVTINVTGPKERRRNLLALIRSEFERIHGKLSKLSPEEFVPVPSHPAVAIPWKKLRVLEDKRVETVNEVSGNEVLELKVADLLHGVDVAAARRKERPAAGPVAGVRVFFSYSHRDETHLGQLKGHVRLLERQGLIEPWDDRLIRPGDDWAGEIDDNLNRADLILFVVSHHFINSDYCYKVERVRALDRYRNREASVVPVILDDVLLEGEEFMKLQVLPTDAKPVLAARHWPNPNAGWRDVAEGIRRVVVEMLKRKAQA